MSLEDDLQAPARRRSIWNEDAEAFVRTVMRTNPELQAMMTRLIKAHIERALTDLDVSSTE